MELVLKDVKKLFNDGTKALAGIDLEVKQGEFVVLLGPIGSGKTTLIKSLNGLEKPTSGSIEIKGTNENYFDKKYLKYRLGVVFQEFNLVENLSSLNNVLTGLLFSSNIFLSMMYIFKKQQKLQALHCLDRVGL